MPIVHLWGHDESTGAPVKCKVTAEGKLIVDASGFLENPPTEDEALKAPTSEWAFDHAADASAHHAATVAGDLDHQDLADRSTDDHHAKYTDAESRAAIGNLFNPSGISLKDINLAWYRLLNISYMRFQTSGVNRYVIIYPPLPSTNYIRFATYKVGVGYDNTELRVLKTSVFKLVIDQDNFQAELDDYLENPPTEDSANTAPTSEWAFDHDADVSAHHAKYTDAEAVAAFYARQTTLTTGTYTAESMTGVSSIFLNTTGGDITIKGLADGTIGQMIFCYRNTSSNNVHVIHASGDAASSDRIYCVTGADESIVANHYGGFWLVFTGSFWQIDHQLI